MGALVTSPRRGETVFDARDREMLDELARQAGPAVRAEALTADLLDSRQRLVTAREEERRRLRRDLHDGLGPMLTGVGLNLDAARGAAARGEDPDVPGRGQGRVRAGDRRPAGLVYDLRPPALDDLGLTGAVPVHAERLGAGTACRARLGRAAGAAGRGRGGRVPDRGRGDQQRRPARRRPALHRTAGRRPGTAPRGRPTTAGRRGPWRPGVGLTAMRERAERAGRALRGRPHRGRRPGRRPLPAGGDRDHRAGRRRPPVGPAGPARGARRCRRAEVVLAEACDGDEVVRLAAELAPDVVVMDLQMPGLHGIEATRQILAHRPGTAILVLTMFEDDDTVFAAVAAGRVRLPAQGRGRCGHRHRDPVRGRRAGRLRGRAGRPAQSLAREPAAPPGRAALPAADRSGAGGPRRRRGRPDQRADRPAALPVREDGGQQRLHDPDQAAGRRSRPGDRAGP